MCIASLSQGALTRELQNPMIGFFPGITSITLCTFFLGAFSEVSVDFSSLGIEVKPQTRSGFSNRHFRLRCSPRVTAVGGWQRCSQGGQLMGIRQHTQHLGQGGDFRAGQEGKQGHSSTPTLTLVFVHTDKIPSQN